MIDMDIITTGASTSTAKEKVNQIKDQIRNIMNDHKSKVLQHGLKYMNLFNFTCDKLRQLVGSTSREAPITEIEFRDALRLLEDQNYITLIGHQREPTIRLVNE